MIAGPSSLTEYLNVSANLTKSLDTFAKTSATYQRDVAHFQAALPNIKSVDDLLKDRQTLTVALGAFQLADQVDAKGLLRKILTQDPADKASLVNQLADPRYKQFAQAFQSLSTDGGAAINAAGFADKIVNGYRVNQFEEQEGQNQPAVREALYFARTAGAVTTTLQVLGDRTLADVVRVAQGLPQEFGALGVDQQVAGLKRAGFDPTKLSDPATLQKYVQRYLVMYDIANPPNGDVTGGLATLFQPADPSTDTASGLLSLLADDPRHTLVLGDLPRDRHGSGRHAARRLRVGRQRIGCEAGP